MPLFSRHSTAYGLAAILLLAWGLRIYRLDTYSLFFDEKSTLLVSQGMALEGATQPGVFSKKYFTPHDFWQPRSTAQYYEAMIRSDIGNAPLYYLLLHYWIELFGKSDAALRMLSVLFSVGTVGLMYVFARRHFLGDRGALLAALLVAVEPFFIAYSHQARTYSLAFFLTLLATHLFLNLTGQPGQKPGRGSWLAYGLVAWAVWFSHFLGIIVIGIHGLYLLLFVRNFRLWVAFGLAMLLPLAGMGWWMTAGGGTYTLRTLAYQAQLYKTIANTTDNVQIRPATWPYIWEKLRHLLADQFLVSNGLTLRMTGRRNFFIATLTAVAGMGLWAFFRRNRPAWLPWAIGGAVVAGLALYTANAPAYLEWQLCLLLLLTLLIFFREKPAPAYFLLLGLTLLPTAFLVLMALRGGHTFGLTQRYAGFSFPAAIILMLLAFRPLSGSGLWLRGLVAVALLGQAIWVADVLREIYADRSLKYTYRSTPRLPNPHYRAALLVEKLYAPGDTVLYPSGLNSDSFGGLDTYTKDLKRSVLDAQLVNVYLPKQARYLQRIDPTEPDKLYLWQKSTGRKRLIADFRGQALRY